MSRQRKVKKSLMQELKKTIHTLTSPKRPPKKTKSRKTTSTKTMTKAKAESSLELQKKLEQDLTRKMTQGMQKIKKEMEQELLKKLTSKRATTNSDEEVSSEEKVRKFSKGVTTKSSTKTTKGKFKPETDCTLLKLLTLSESLERRVVVGYEVLDNSSQEIWGIDIHEGAKLGRAKKILNTKVKSRKVGSERQYYLVHVTDDALYYSDEYAKAALERGRLTIRKYTPELADAIKSAYDSGYKKQ